MDNESSEADLISQGRGKWGNKGVPHKGWICSDIEDRGAPDRICDMCESQEIRYAHLMEHPDYPNTLVVGCICAGNMEQDLLAAKRRDKQMRSRFAKRKKWLDRQWKLSRKGNDYIMADGYTITIFHNGEGWKASLSKNETLDIVYSKRTFDTENRAKLAAFDRITSLLAENRKAFHFRPKIT